MIASKNDIFIFLNDLSNNNSKDWMDRNRDRYQKAKERWLEEVEAILERLSAYDSYFDQFKPKDTITRTNNNRVFHPDKPIYKDYFSCSPNAKGEPVSKLHISAGISWSFLGGGLWRPDKEILKRVRDAIDYNGDELLEILNVSKFKKIFGGLAEDPDKLKTTPRDYPKDHKYIQLLRYNNLTARADLTVDMVQSDHFVDYVEEVYLTIRPFNDYLEKAISVT
ncbi:MAG: DUF2461 domain-containing protein [Bacteroidota bacterium]